MWVTGLKIEQKVMVPTLGQMVSIIIIINILDDRYDGEWVACKK
jgi:hypothetical protein